MFFRKKVLEVYSGHKLFLTTLDNNVILMKYSLFLLFVYQCMWVKIKTSSIPKRLNSNADISHIILHDKMKIQSVFQEGDVI